MSPRAIRVWTLHEHVSTYCESDCDHWVAANGYKLSGTIQMVALRGPKERLTEIQHAMNPDSAVSAKACTVFCITNPSSAHLHRVST